MTRSVEDSELSRELTPQERSAISQPKSPAAIALNISVLEDEVERLRNALIQIRDYRAVPMEPNGAAHAEAMRKIARAAVS